jgi:hypothetical protein
VTEGGNNSRQRLLHQGWGWRRTWKISIASVWQRDLLSVLGQSFLANDKRCTRIDSACTWKTMMNWLELAADSFVVHKTIEFVE